MTRPWDDKPDGEALLDTLAQLVAADNGERLLRAPLILPTAAFFPEPWEPTLVGLGRLLHRLLHHAQLGGYRLAIEDARPPLDDPGQQLVPLVEFITAEEGQLVFHVEQLGEPAWLLARLCFEVARAHLGNRAAEHPYRPEPVATQTGADQQAHQRAAVATIALGFGPLTANAPMLDGAFPGDMTFLLAVQLCLRGLDEKGTDTVLAGLGGERAEDVRRWLAALQPARVALRRRLRLAEPSPVATVEPPPEVPPMEAQTLALLQAAEQHHQQPFRRHHTTRYVEHRTGSYAMIALLLAVVPALLLLLEPSAWPFTVLILVTAALIGAAVGRRRRSAYCGQCWMLLRDDDLGCPKCGASFAGEAPLSQRGANEADEVDEDPDRDDDSDELTRQALAAGGRQRFGENGSV